MDAFPSWISAAQDGKLQEVRNQLQEDGANVNATNSYLDTGLMKASVNGHVEIVIELLKHKDVDVNQTNIDGDTALILASYCGHADIVDELLKHDSVNVNLRNNSQRTALDMAMRTGRRDVETILKHYNQSREEAGSKNCCRYLYNKLKIRFAACLKVLVPSNQTRHSTTHNP